MRKNPSNIAFIAVPWPGVGASIPPASIATGAVTPSVVNTYDSRQNDIGSDIGFRPLAGQILRACKVLDEADLRAVLELAEWVGADKTEPPRAPGSAWRP